MKIEDGIHLLTNLKDLLHTLVQNYKLLENTITHEHELISNRDLHQLEALLKNKVEISNAIVSASQSLQRLSMKFCSGKTLGVTKLCNSIVDLVQSECQITTSSRSTQKIFEHSMSQLKSAQVEFQSCYKSLKPLVEQNAYIIGRFIEKQRSYLQLWQETIASTEQGYSSFGEVKRRKQPSMLVAKA